MNITVLSSVTEKMQGVKGLDRLDKDDLYIFTNIDVGTQFHMEGVKFPISIAFLNKNCEILDIKTLDADTGRAKAPTHCAYAVEACKDYFTDNKMKTGDFFKTAYIHVNRP